jgi:hypothetical protein
MLFLLSFIACKGDLLANAGEFGRILYTLETDYKIDGFKLTEAKIATGYPQRISASLTPSGWKMVGDEPFSVYHVSADEDNLVVDSESLLDGEMGVPGFTVQGNAAGSFTIESKLQDEIVDQIALNFVVPDEVSVLSWVRGPNTEEFGEEEGDNIKVSVGSQAAFIPIPQFEGERIIGDLEVEISIDPPEAAVEGYNIESVQEGGVVASSNPASVYFVQEGGVEVCAKDVVNDVESCQKFTVE